MPSSARVTSTAAKPWAARNDCAAMITPSTVSTAIPVASANSRRFGVMMSAPA
jgi:hypothetical protein